MENKNIDNIREISVFEFMKETGILEIFANLYLEIPNSVPLLINALEREELNYWSYSIEDKDEIKDIENTVLVYDIEYGKRYFELTETEEF